MKYILSILSMLLLTTILSFGQSSTTNQWYQKGDMTISVGPTILFPSLVNKHNQFGWSGEATYWQTLYTGTSVEFGDVNAKNFNPELIDHISALENMRILPFNSSPIFSRLDFILITGTDTRLSDGSKGVIIGLGSEFAVTQNIRITASIKESFESIATDSGETGFFGVEFKF